MPLFLGVLLLSGFTGLSSSSGADDALFVRTQAELERLWSGVLGCAESNEPFTVRNRFNDSGGFEDAGGGAAPAGTSSDYSECGKRALRNASSRMLVDAVEGALRGGGLALFEEGFRIDSSIGWTAGESVRGALDAVLPLWSNTGTEGTGRVLFLQPGAVFWSGHAEQERIDTNLGLVFRRSFSRDLVGGVSVFYDRNLDRELERIGGGLDIQGGIFTGGLNYYHPLGGGWREGRIDYEERAQRGMDLRIGLATEDVRFDGSMGLWRFKGEEDEATKWRPSLGVDAGFRVLPGIFLEAGYEYHNKEDSLGSRWNMGLAFRFDLPGLQGSGFGSPGYIKPDLWRPVEREKRVLYEERLAVPRVELTTEEEDVRVAEGGTAMITGVIAKPLKQDAALHLVMHSTSTATHGSDGDFTLGHRVFEGDAPPPGEMTDCPVLPCVVPLPAGTTMFEVSVNALADETNEVDEHIDLRAEVPAAHTGVLRSSGTVRVTIGAHDNTIAFGESSQTEVEEADGTAEVVVDVHLPAPMPVVLNIAAVGGTATHQGEEADYILPPSVTIPAGQSSGMVVLRGRDDSDGEGSETVFLGLTAAGELPEGWVLQESATHRVTITDDDLAIGFAEAEHEEAEPASGTTTFTVAVELTMSPEEEVTVPIVVADNSKEFVSADVSYAPASLTFAAGTTDLSQDVTFTVHADATPEADEVVRFLIEDHDSHTEGANAFSVGQRSFALTIPANDNAVQLSSLTGSSFEEGESVSLSVVSDDDHPAPNGGLPLVVTVTPQRECPGGSVAGQPCEQSSASAEDISFTANQVILAGQASVAFDIDVVNDAEAELVESFEISIAEGVNFPSAWGSVINVPAVFNISANDNTIGFAQSASRVIENVSGGTHNVAVNANLPLPMSAQSVTFNIAPGGTATENTDYSLSGTTVTVNAGTESVNIPVTIVNDSDVDVGETIELTLSPASNASLPAGWSFGATTHTVTIIDDEAPGGVFSFAAPAPGFPTAEPDSGTTDFTVGINAAGRLPDNAFTLVVAIDRDGTTADAKDYTVAQTLSSIPVNGMTVVDGVLMLNFSIFADDIEEPTETITLVLPTEQPGLAGTGWSVDAAGQTTHVITIPANDVPIARTITFSKAVSSLTEGADYSTGDTNEARLTITPVPDVRINIPVVVTGDMDAYDLAVESLSGGASYANDMVTFPANESSVTFTVTPEDDEDAADELVTVTIGQLPSNYSYGANRAWRVTINDPDAGNSVAFAPAVGQDTANEGETLEIPVRLSENATADLAFGWSVNETGVDDVDPASGEITIQAGSNSAILPITVKENDGPEIDEEITVTLTDKDDTDDYDIHPERGTHTFTVPANENLVGFEEIADQTGTFGEADTNATRDVRISVLQPVESDIRISLVLSGTADPVTDYTLNVKSPPTATYANGMLTLPAGEGQIDFTVTVVDDTDNSRDFADEDIVFTLGDPEENLPEGWAIDTSNDTHTLTIVDDDEPAANTMGFATNGVITGETVGSDPCASFGPHNNCIAVAYQINPGISDADVKGMLSLMAGDGSAADTDDIYIVAEGGDGSRLAATELVYQSTGGAGGGNEKTIYVYLVDDVIPEGTEVYTLTASGAPGTHTLVNSTFTITVTDDDTADVGFKEAASTGMESTSNSSMFEIGLSAPAPAGGISLGLTLDNTTGSPVYDVADASKAGYAQSSGLLTVNEGEMSVTLVGSQDNDTDNLNNRYVFTLSERNNSLPEGWMINANKDTHTVTFVDANPLDSTIGWEKTAVAVREDDGLVVVNLKLTDTAGGGVPFTSAIPELTFMAGSSDASDFTIDIGDAGTWTANTGAVALTAGASYEDGLVGVNFNVTDDAFEEGTQTHTFTLAGVRFPQGWKVDEDKKTLTFTVADDDIPREGGNTVEFATASGTISEFNRQSITTKVVIDRPSKDEMKFLLIAEAPDEGATADDDDYELTVGSPAVYDAATGIVTIPAGTTGFDVSVAAESDTEDENDFESVVLTLSEGEDAMLPDGWRIGEGNTFTVTIFDSDGATRPAATLSQWPRDGANAGGLAQLSSTTRESGVAFGAVYLTRAGPEPGGIPLVLTVEEGHEGDVNIVNHEAKRSTITEDAIKGRYNFVVKGGNVNGSPNLAALFRIDVVNDEVNEPVEVIDISVSMGEGFPAGWTLHDDVVYRLTVPRDASDTGGEVGFAAEGPSVNRAVVIEGQSGIERVIEASAPAPRGGLSFTWEATGTNVGDVISETSGTLTISEGRSRSSFSFDITDNDDVSSEDAVITFMLRGSNLPDGWKIPDGVHTMTVTDDDLPRAVGGNTVEFAHAAANINEAGEQSVATKVLINRSHKAEMNLLLTADAPASGSAAQDGDYTFSVRSPASYDPDTNILTIPAETREFEVEVAAVADDDDDDFEAIALTLKESADSATGAQLPEGWRIGERSSFTVTIFDEDGPDHHPTASLSEWLRAGANKGRYAQLSSTTAEGGTAPAAIVLTERSPGPDGLNFVLKVEEGHEDDVILADFGDGRSTLVPGRVRGEYLFHMTGGDSNLAAIFNVNVVDDDENEPVEVVDIFLSKGADFPGNWTVREEVSYRLTIPRDAGDGGGTLGFAESASMVVEGQRGVVRVVEASAPAPTDITLNWTATVATDPPSDSPPAPGDVISETSGTLTVYGGYRRAEFSFNSTDNAIAGLVEPVVTFELTASGLPEGWTLARPTHVMTIRDDDVTRLGGNLVFFENAAANVNEDGLQKVSTRIRIDRPGNAEMRFLLARGGPATGAAAGNDDYTFSVKSPAVHDPATDIVTVPPGTNGFGLEVTARDDAVDDDSEAVVFTLLEAAGAMLPEGWEIDGDRRRFTVTIIDDDGAEQQPSATLSRWHREGHNAGRYAQLSSTTAEGGTVQGAVYLTQAGPHPEGLHFLLTVEDGHALDVTLTDYGDNRSTLLASETTPGLYHFHMTGGRLGPYASPPPNLAALFNIHVQEDVPREAEEVVDITLSAGENFPDGWTVRGDAVYRLTIPGEESNVRFRTATSATGEGRSRHSVQVEVRPPASEDLTFTITHAGTVGPNTASSNDYSLDSNTLTIKAGESGGSITVNITDDDEIEADETIVLALSGKVPTGYRLDRSLHTLTIKDDDNNTVGFETASASVEEGEEVNLRIKLEDPAGAALASLDRNLPLSVLFDDGDDHDVTFTGHLTLLTPSSTLSDGVFEIAAPVLAVVDNEREVEETVTFTLKEGANFPDNFVIDFSADRFTLTIAANGHPEAGVIRFAETNMTFREPYAGEETGVPPEIRSVLASGCANSNQGNCIVYYFDLEITGVPEEPFDLIIDRYSEAKGHALGTSFYTHEWGHPTRHRITPEDARDGRTRVPIAIARDDDFEDTEHWGLELRPHGLPEGWRIERWDARVNILDSTGGQLWFVDNDEDNGVETFNHSIINEGETVKVRIVANHVDDIDTPLSVSIEGHTPGFFQGSHPDIIGAPYDVTVGRYKVWVDMEITARDDNIAEEDETYTLVLGQGFGWQDYHGRRVDPARSRYTFTIPANDGPVPLAEGVAQLSEWTLEGSRRGLFAQTSSTTAEGSVAQGAVVLNVSAPEPDGLNLILKVEPGHEDDVFLTNAESARSSLAAGDVPGEYLFNIKSSRVNSVDNLAALFNIHVVDDALVEEAEEIEISLLPGAGVPRYWTVRGESPYRLTVPADADDTDSHTIAWETQTSVLDEDAVASADGITVKLLIDDPLASNAAVGVDLPDTIAVADVANGSYDAAARALTINAGEGEVTLTIVSTGDVTGHTLAVLRMAELAGTGELPAGWSVGEGVHVVTIEDNDRVLWFARSEWSIREGESGTVELRVRPSLISTDVSVPFLLVGDADAYRLPNLSSFARSTVPGEERNATATLASNRNTNVNSIPVTIEALEDTDRFNDTVTFAIDEDSLPEGYVLGTPSVATITILDDDRRVVTFVGEDGRTEENSGQAVSIELQISPPLGPGEFASIPLKVTGDADAYTLTTLGFELDGPTASILYLGPLSLGPFEPPPSSAPDSRTLTVTPPYSDNDMVFDLVTVEIDRDRLPPGFRLGDKTSWRVEIPDDQLRTVSWAYSNATANEGGALVSVDLRVHPPFPSGETFYISGNMVDYWSPHGAQVHEVVTTGTVHRNDFATYSYWYGNSGLTMSWYARPDGNNHSETFVATLHPSACCKPGAHPTFTVYSRDDD